MSFWSRWLDRKSKNDAVTETEAQLAFSEPEKRTLGEPADSLRIEEEWVGKQPWTGYLRREKSEHRATSPVLLYPNTTESNMSVTSALPKKENDLIQPSDSPVRSGFSDIDWSSWPPIDSMDPDLLTLEAQETLPAESSQPISIPKSSDSLTDNTPKEGIRELEAGESPTSSTQDKTVSRATRRRLWYRANERLPQSSPSTGIGRKLSPSFPRHIRRGYHRVNTKSKPQMNRIVELKAINEIADPDQNFRPIPIEIAEHPSMIPFKVPDAINEPSHDERDDFTDSAYGTATNSVPDHGSVWAKYDLDKDKDLHYMAQPRTLVGYSRLPRVYSLEKDKAVFTFLGDLLTDIHSTLPGESGFVDLTNARSAESIATILHEALRIFALKIGNYYESFPENNPHRALMFFIHKYRREITETFVKFYCPKLQSKLSTMSTQDAINDWTLGLGGLAEEESMEELPDSAVEDTEDDKIENEDSEVLKQLKYHRELINETDAYTWLRGRLRREALFTTPGFNFMMEMSRTVIKDLMDPRTSRPMPLRRASVLFCVDWDPHDFFPDTDTEDGTKIIVGKTLIIVGSTKDGQASSVSQYMRQVWPTTYQGVVELVEKLIGGKRGLRHSYALPDKTMLSVWMENSVLLVNASGLGYSLAELAEQLAFLGACLRHSRQLEGYDISFLLPKITRVEDCKKLAPSHSAVDTFIWNIEFENQEARASPTPLNGECWIALFHQPVVVEGYPIWRRPKPGTGLEMTLSLAATLVQAERITTFDGRVFVKGLRALLVLCNVSDGICVWHLIKKEGTGAISYDDAPKMGCVISNKFDIASLEDARHIVGWCSKVKSNAGDPGAVYGTETLQPKRCIDRFGKTLDHGRPIIFGDIPNLIRSDLGKPFKEGSYSDRLIELYDKKVVIYDIDTMRGCLFDGLSILLHLSRSCIDSERSCKSFGHLFKFSFLENDAISPSAGNSTFNVLSNPKNRNGTLRQDSVVTLEKKVNEIYWTLDVIFEAQKRRGKVFTGYSFVDIATSGKRLNIRYMEEALAADSPSWTEFVNDLGAPVLVGCEFGDLIKSTCGKQSCQKVSLTKDHLTVLGRDWRRLLDNGIERSDHWSIDISGITRSWYPSYCSTQTNCSGLECPQVLHLGAWSPQSSSSSAKKHIEPKQHGAIVFKCCTNSIDGKMNSSCCAKLSEPENDAISGEDLSLVQISTPSGTSREHITRSMPDRLDDLHKGSIYILPTSTHSSVIDESYKEAIYTSDEERMSTSMSEPDQMHDIKDENASTQSANATEGDKVHHWKPRRENQTTKSSSLIQSRGPAGVSSQIVNGSFTGEVPRATNSQDKPTSRHGDSCLERSLGRIQSDLSMPQTAQPSNRQAPEQRRVQTSRPLGHDHMSGNFQYLRDRLRVPRVAVCVAMFALSLCLESFYWKTVTISSMATGLSYSLKMRNLKASKKISGMILGIRFILTIWCLFLSPFHIFIGSDVRDRLPVEPLIIHEPGGKQTYVDVFAIHGLGSNSSTAWTFQGSKEPVHWLEDILPRQKGCQHIRVTMINHQTQWNSHVLDMDLNEHAMSILTQIEAVNEGQRPIIFIAHSFGGILLKKALVLAERSKAYRPIADHTMGILFLGVPHFGTKVAFIASLRSCFSYWRGSSTRLLEEISWKNPSLSILDKDFREIYAPYYTGSEMRPPYICNFRETRLERIHQLSISTTVENESVQLDYAQNVPLDTDHRGLNKFRSSTDPNFKIWLRHFRKALDNALGEVL